MGQFIDRRTNDSIRLIIATTSHLSRSAGSSFNDVITSVPANYRLGTVSAFLAVTSALIYLTTAKMYSIIIISGITLVTAT